ncbi:hypothetical protein PV325_010904 [Microctonus aethiopoides]|nr:hypothetical protein PV325_010904 [Microctonus aethiopoides]
MEWTLRFSSWLSAIIIVILKPYFWIRDWEQPPKLPPANDELLNISAVKLAKMIRHGEVSSEHVVKTYIERIKKVNSLLNAVVEDRFDAALIDAKKCDKMLTLNEVTIHQLEEQMPFFGVPFTVKESCGLKGLSYTGCTKVREGIKADEDSLIVQNMKAAGAIPLCVTNTPELCSGFETVNSLYGVTRNPYDGRHSAGGSSGGEGALIGAGASLFGIGSDIAGSIRLPALFNGVFGHKSTPGIIPIKGHFPMVECDEFKKYLVLGPIARYAEDLHALVKVMSSGCERNLRLDEPVNFAKLKVFYLENVEKNFGIKPVDSEIRNAIKRAATHFEKIGAKVDKAIIPDLSESCEMGILALFEMPDMPNILIHPKDPKIKVNALWELMKSIFGCSNYSKSAIFTAVLEQFNGLIFPFRAVKYSGKLKLLENKLLQMLGDDGVFIYPTFPTSAPRFGQIFVQSAAGMYCLLCNILGLPATEVPMGLNRQGLPIGFQVIAAPNNDRLCLAVATELERAFGGWIPPRPEPFIPF